MWSESEQPRAREVNNGMVGAAVSDPRRVWRLVAGTCEGLRAEHLYVLVKAFRKHPTKPGMIVKPHGVYSRNSPWEVAWALVSPRHPLDRRPRWPSGRRFRVSRSSDRRWDASSRLRGNVGTVPRAAQHLGSLPADVVGGCSFREAPERNTGESGRQSLSIGPTELRPDGLGGFL
ncbi:MAG: hypothetical protein QOG97_3528 [Acidimicrobiaceae bacterium]|nr:hypothetical protein [Acidimicrobiaceae bacterium]